MYDYGAIFASIGHDAAKREITYAIVRNLAGQPPAHTEK